MGKWSAMAAAYGVPQWTPAPGEYLRTRLYYYDGPLGRKNDEVYRVSEEKSNLTLVAESADPEELNRMKEMWIRQQGWKKPERLRDRMFGVSVYRKDDGNIVEGRITRA